MSDTAIRVDGVSKRFRIGTVRPRYNTIRDTLSHGLASALRRVRTPSAAKDPGIFWALRDVNFEVGRGEVLGIIGPNGAGKSTLLKILSRITEPTTGQVELHGRVGSLLEVGTGFHPELSGRENIFLSGAILGMRRTEIERKLEEIVEFAEVERFLETPVKHFSSGMYLRLAFAVAAHLEPEILIVDEVLAVGDAAFQQKCLGKMENVAGTGRTVLFVSHNMNAVRSLCSRCLILDGGRVVANGAPSDLIVQYISKVRSETAPETWIDLAAAQRAGTGEARFAAVKYRGAAARFDGHLHADGPAEFMCAIDCDERMAVGSLAVSLSTVEGERLVNMDSVLQGRSIELLPGRNLVRVATTALHLNPGIYKVGLWLANPIKATSGSSAYDYLQTAFHVEVADVRPSAFGLKPNALVTCGFEVARADGASARSATGVAVAPNRALG